MIVASSDRPLDRVDRDAFVGVAGSNPIEIVLLAFVAYNIVLPTLISHGCLRAYDELRPALALDDTLGSTRAGTVDVELRGALTRAMTVVDWEGLWGRPPNADVAVDVDVDRFLGELVAALARLTFDSRPGNTG